MIYSVYLQVKVATVVSYLLIIFSIRNKTC